ALFDGDEAGRKAASRSFEIFVEAGLFGRAALLPKGEDPDTFVRGQGKEAVEELLNRSIPMADYYFSWLEQRYGKSMEGKSQIAGEISRLLQKVRNAFEVDLLVARAVDTLGVREEVLRRPLRESAPAKLALVPTRGVSSIDSSRRDHVADKSLISLVLRFPEIAREVFKDADVRQWFGSSWGPIVDVIGAEWQEHGNIDVSRIAQKVEAEQAAQIAGLAIEGENIAESESKQMALDCIAHLRRKYFRGLERNLRIAIRTAEEQQDENAKRERILEWQDIVRRERQLEHRKLEPKTTVR
ncbi:MAG: toprim domain-containing protein, partial [bacterium]